MSSIRLLGCILSVLLALFVHSTVTAQTHFVPNWSGTPYQPMNIYLTSIELQDPALALTTGDEVAAFDGDECVGATVITAPMGAFIQIIASTNDGTTPQVDGFTTGHAITLRYWKQSNDKEDDPPPFSLVFSVGDGTFSSMGTAVAQVIFKGLPVQLSSFRAASAMNGGVGLEWETLSESNNYGFEVERSLQATTGFTLLAGSFVSGRGTTVLPQRYSFVDSTVSRGTWYYRLRQTDLDGTVQHSDVVSATVGLTGVEESVPEVFTLDQNYPNPFNPSTTIRFATPTSGNVELKVYSILGMEVATLFDGMAEAGRFYSATFKAEGLASGIYYYALSASDRKEVKRMMLLR